ncbi:MAG: UDP-glucose 4-epimerase [Limisphaerales bacterium]|jgi:UDP-glucose 4-epimerase
MRVLITGGAGYIGTSLCRMLLDKGVEEIIVYDNLSRGNYNFFIGSPKLDNRVRFVHGDILDSRALKNELKGVDVVYHLAAKVTTPFGDEHPHLFEQVNHWGTAEMVYAIEDSDVSRFVYLSSGSVYGASDEAMTEESLVNPKTFYGISKLRGESHVNRLFSSSKKVFIIRCGNIYGYNRSMRFDSVINKFIFDGNFKKQIAVDGNGAQRRSFIHVQRASDILSALTSVPSEKLASGIYNLVDFTMDVNGVVEVVKALIPPLEMIYINQNLKLRELLLQPNEKLNALSQAKALPLREHLVDFLEELSF